MNNEKEKSPRKNKNGDFSVDWSKIQSNEYSNKLKKLSSINDINALYNNTNVSGITVGHNGSIYYYTRPNAIISDDWNIAMRHFNKYSDVTAMEKTLVLLSKKYQFTFKKL